MTKHSTIRLLSWNARRANSAAIDLADRFGAEVLLLKEGQAASSWSGEAVGVPVAGRTWGSWVLVRSGALEPIAIAEYPGWVIGARWQRRDAEDVYLFSVHSPTPPRVSYVAESQAIVTAICASVPSAAPLVIGGDFNFKSLGQRLPSETIQTTMAELQAIQEFRDRGLSVAWHDCHPGKPLQQTLRWTNDQSVPFHCDGFLTRNLGHGTVNCEVILPESEPPTSDHNAVLLTVSLTATALESIK